MQKKYLAIVIHGFMLNPQVRKNYRNLIDICKSKKSRDLYLALMFWRWRESNGKFAREKKIDIEAGYYNLKTGSVELL